MLFNEFRNKLQEGAKKQNVVFSKKINRIPVKIYKDGNKFVVEVDGDHLDDYRSQKEAERFAKEFVKEIK